LTHISGCLTLKPTALTNTDLTIVATGVSTEPMAVIMDYIVDNGNPIVIY
jgi:hypothetical protein